MPSYFDFAGRYPTQLRNAAGVSYLGRIANVAFCDLAPEKWRRLWPVRSHVQNVENKGTATAVLGRVIEPLGRCLTPNSAREILGLRPDETAVRRVEELTSKSQAGTLSPEERAEYQLFVDVGDLLALLQAKARRYLAENAGG